MSIRNNDDRVERLKKEVDENRAVINELKAELNPSAEPASPDGSAAGDLHRATYTVKSIFRQAFNLENDTAPYDVINDRLTAGGQITGSNLAVLFLAIVIASVGLNMNSTAVIIGAMCVSPLMGTILMMALSVSTGDSQKFKKGAFGFGFQVITALATSTIYFLISPISTATSELLGRTSPTIYDVLIAVAGGLAGIIANTRKDSYNTVIPGVAIATALMPPLCTCGYSIANGHWNMLAGAAFLFVINAYFIFLSATVILYILEVPKVGQVSEARMKHTRNVLIRNAAIILVISILLGINLVRTTNSKDNQTADQVTSMTVSTADVTEQLEILFPQIESVQVGQLEKVGDDGNTITENIMVLSVSDDLSEEEKDRLSAFVKTVYDEDYTILYGDPADIIEAGK